jgi:molybdenum cofactor guanylyltransferase
VSIGRQSTGSRAWGEGRAFLDTGGRDGRRSVSSGGPAVEPVAGMLLTGGASRRMGTDKASMVIDGHPSASRIGVLLSRVAAPVLEVGPGRSGLPAVREDGGGEGPLVALCAGRMALRAAGHAGPTVVVACDLPLVTEEVLEFLARYPGGASVVPVVGGRPQPLCARWSAADLDAASALVAAGERTCTALIAQSKAVVLDDDGWTAVAEARVFADVDVPEDLDRLGLTWHRGHGGPAA